MNILKTLVIPDQALTDMAFMNSCLIYADKLIISPYEAPIPNKSVIDNHFKQLALKYGLDFDTAVQKHRQVIEINEKLRILEDAGIVDRWTPEESIIGYKEAGDKFQELTNKVLSHPDELSSIIEASSATGAWADDSFGVSRKSDQSDPGDYSFYTLRVIQRLLAAYRSGSQITTNKFIHYKAIGHIQRLILEQPHVVPRFYVTEVIRLTVPYLVCKDLVDVLEVREKLKDYLEPFRVELCKLVTDIPEDILSEKVPAELQKIIEKNILPQVVELRRYLEKPHHVLIKHLVSGFQSIATAGVTFIGFMVVGADLTTAAVAAPLIHVLSAGLQTAQEISKVKFENPLTFVVLTEKHSYNTNK